MLYTKIPDKNNVTMEDVAVPTDDMLLIRFNKVGIRPEKKKIRKFFKKIEIVLYL